MNQSLYFNEFEPYAAEWLRNLYPGSTVDERSIKDVAAEDVRRFRRCHFFGGIGGWQYALELAGWPIDKDVWTGSCPCQPFSDCGKQQGEKDERHLWPEYYSLISQHQPSVVFGEQVASKIGREWLDGVSLDLEELGYAVGSSDLCAAGVAAPHIRQRLFWVAYSESDQHEWTQRNENQTGRSGSANGCAGRDTVGGSGELDASGLVDSVETGSQGHRRDGENGCESRWINSVQTGSTPTPGAWTASGVVHCLDGKARRVPLPESSIQPLAYGLSRSLGKGRSKADRMVIRSARTNRVGRLKGYGNAIVPQVAAVFIQAFMEAASLVVNQKAQD